MAYYWDQVCKDRQRLIFHQAKLIYILVGHLIDEMEVRVPTNFDRRGSQPGCRCHLRGTSLFKFMVPYCMRRYKRGGLRSGEYLPYPAWCDSMYETRKDCEHARDTTEALVALLSVMNLI
jgi:hypothetical protein